jgi:hypothetical protein
MENILGTEEWDAYFDFVIVKIRRPLFFNAQQPFTTKSGKPLHALSMLI